MCRLHPASPRPLPSSWGRRGKQASTAAARRHVVVQRVAECPRIAAWPQPTGSSPHAISCSPAGPITTRRRRTSGGRRSTASTGRSTTSTRSPQATHVRRSGSSTRTAPNVAVPSRSSRRARTGWRTSCATLGVQPRRSPAAHARQRGGALGDDARRHEARRRRRAGDDAPHRRRSPGPHRARRHRATSWPVSRTRSASTGLDGDYTRIARRRRRAGLAAALETPPRRRPRFTRTDRRARPIRCCSTSRRARRRSRSSCCTRTRAIRSVICRRCTGSGCSPATCTGTSARRAGRSTPGAASSRRGTPARRSSSTTTRASSRGACSTRSCAPA